MRVITRSLHLSAVLAGCILWAPPMQAAGGDNLNGHFEVRAGTTFDLNAVFDAGGNPIFPWHHGVRGIVQTSNLGNATGRFQVTITAGDTCPGGHLFCLDGTLSIKTLSGDELLGEVRGWADPDPNDLTGSMFLLHYDVTITGGTGALLNAQGSGEINGAFFFCGADCYCDEYAGVATWVLQGVLHVPKSK